MVINLKRTNSLYHSEIDLSVKSFLFFFVLIYCCFLLLGSIAVRAQSEPVTVGYRDFKYGSGVTSKVTGEKPQSKLWWNDGYWWGNLWDPDETAYKIYRFNSVTQSWENTGTVVDNRGETKADVLWDGEKLYIVSHYYDKNAGPTSEESSARLYRYSYTAGNYTLDTGFPVLVNRSKSETLVLDKDSTGKLWITWIENNKVKVNRSINNDLSWGEPFDLPVQGSDTGSENDISSTVAFGGDKIGIMWSNQKDEVIYFAVHRDGDPDSVWQEREEALADESLGAVADNHLNLKSGPDTSGAVYAVTKTSLAGDKPLIFLLKRDSIGVWTRSVFGTALENHTRPSLLIDNENNLAYVFAMSSQNETQSFVIYMKIANLDDLIFPSGLGIPFIQSETDNSINNVTSTKQTVSNATGLLVLASDHHTKYYFHNYINASEKKPVIYSFSPTSGSAGTPVEITGLNLSGATEVAFNGTVVSDFSISSDNEIHTSVPDGAQSGPISVTNAEGSGFSSSDFTIGASPVLSGISDQIMNEGEFLELAVSATDPDGGKISLTVHNLPAFGSLKDNKDGTGVIRFLPDFVDAGVYPDIEVTATDNDKPPLSDMTVFTLTVKDVNRAPILNAISNQTVGEGKQLDVAVTASDPDGDELVLSVNDLPAFGNFTDHGDGTGTIRFSPGFEDAGFYPRIEVIGKDNGTPSRLDTVAFTLNVSGVNRAPQVSSISDQFIDEGGILEVMVSAADVDGDPLTLTVANLPSFASFSDDGGGRGLIRFFPSFFDAGHYSAIEVIATDIGSPPLSDSIIFNLTVNNVNQAPVAVGDIVTTNEDHSFSLAVLSNDQDPDGDKLRLKSVMPGKLGSISIAVGDSTINYEPVPDSNGVDIFRYVVEDGNGGMDTADVAVTIKPVNDVPTISGFPDSITFDANASITLDIWEAVHDIETPVADLGYSFLVIPDTLKFLYKSDTGKLLLLAKNTIDRSNADLIISVMDPARAQVSDTIRVNIQGVVRINDPSAGSTPEDYILMQNYPNPFNPSTRIKFGLPQAGKVRIDLYNILGERVETILNEERPAGYHVIQFEGRGLSGGIYFYHLRSGDFQTVRKMILLQ